MRVLNITYKKNEVARFRITSPLILIGRSPLCDISLRVPGLNSVHFIFEWIGAGDFDSAKAVHDEWAVTEIGEKGLKSNEKNAGQSVRGTGAIFHDMPLQLGDLVFSWVEDRLVEADLDKKLISQQIESIKKGTAAASSKKLVPILEVISINKEVDSVGAVQHIPFSTPRAWNTPLLNSFAVTPRVQDGQRIARIQPPLNARSQLIRQGFGVEESTSATVDLGLHDVLHIEDKESEYYFRVVPKVYVPAARRAIWSDPFYLISAFCVMIGAFGFFLIFRNVKNERQTIVAPPRIAQVNIVEVKKETPVEKPPEPEIETPEPLPTPPAPEVSESLRKDNLPRSDQAMIPDKMPVTKQKIQANDSVNVKNAPKIVDRSKGSLDIPTEKSVVNRTGFLGALKRSKNVGMVKADQILDKGVVQDTVKGESAHFVVEQAASGMVNNQIRKSGDTLAAASTQLNFKDKVGNGSLNADNGKNLREGFSASYGVSGEGGLSDSGFDGMVQAEIQGGLSRQDVQSAIRGYKAEIRTCFEKALRVKSGIGGRVSYKFQILAPGNVNWINVNKDDTNSASLVDCVQSVVKRIKFPVAKNGQSTIVIYPFQFAKKGN